MTTPDNPQFDTSAFTDPETGAVTDFDLLYEMLPAVVEAGEGEAASTFMQARLAADNLARHEKAALLHMLGSLREELGDTEGALRYRCLSAEQARSDKQFAGTATFLGLALRDLLTLERFQQAREMVPDIRSALREYYKLRDMGTVLRDDRNDTLVTHEAYAGLDAYYDALLSTSDNARARRELTEDLLEAVSPNDKAILWRNVALLDLKEEKITDALDALRRADEEAAGADLFVEAAISAGLAVTTRAQYMKGQGIMGEVHNMQRYIRLAKERTPEHPQLKAVLAVFEEAGLIAGRYGYDVTEE